jgi:hypothetical protein
MRTLGIDLSADPRKTAACVLDWTDGTATVARLSLGWKDAPLVELMSEPSIAWVAIDAPFGWPTAFLAAVTGWAEQGTWEATDRRQLRFRETDRFVEAQARLPLSVSSDRIAVTAMRCASLLTQLGERRSGPGGRIDRTGDDRVVECYPGAALVMWSDDAADILLDANGYKGSGGAKLRRVLVESLRRAAPWLMLDDDQKQLVLKSDDALDAVIAALVARAAAGEQTMLPETMEQTVAASVEGWVHLPKPETLSALPTAMS